MNERLRPIVIGPQSTIREAMEKIDAAGHQQIPVPVGIVLILEQDAFLGIATDGDIRDAILKGKVLEDPIESIMNTTPLTVRHCETPDGILLNFHTALRERNISENRFHHIITVDEAGNLVDVFTPFELWKHSEVKIKTAAVIGLGYVGLTLALTLNEFGIRVIGVDTNEGIINKLKNCTPHFFEKGLDVLLKKHANKLLTLKTSLDEKESDTYVISVGTPVDEDGTVIMSHLEDAVTNVGRVLKPYDLVILRSTVPMGTCRNVVIPLLEKTSGLSAESDFFIAFAPERTVEGKALEELKTLPQIIGGYNTQSLEMATKFFQIFADTIVSVESLEEAEAVKLLNNTFRDISFSFANEVAQVCDGFNLNALNIINAANKGYVRNPIPTPSPGVGGMCLVKDPLLFAQSAKNVGCSVQLPLAGRAINTSMTAFVCKKVMRFLHESELDPKTAKIFIMGMTFKGEPETSDLRFSPSVSILQQLQKEIPNIAVYDPVAHMDELSALGAAVTGEPADGCKDANATLVLNNHPSFRNLDIFTLVSTMSRPGLLFDPWGMYKKEQFSSLDDIVYAGL